MSDKVRDEVLRLGGDIIDSDRFAKAREVPHHYGRSIADHSIEAAEHAVRLVEWLKGQGVDISEEDAVRASLLHDIGMTVDEVFLSPSHRKAYSHPKEGARIAREEFGANDIQVDAILYHMWPIGFIPPHNPEGWVVVAADKSCSMNESWTVAKTLAHMPAAVLKGMLARRKRP